MKKISLVLTMLTLALISQAQTYEDIKNFAMIGQYKKAKEDLDKRMTNPKFTSKPEAYLLKATIYGVLAGDSANLNKPEGAALLTESEAAWAKYVEMDPTMAMATDPTYKNAPIAIYSNNFSAGYKLYEAKNYADAFTRFKKVSDYSDLLTKLKLLNSAIDTNVLILAAFTAENSNQRPEAAKYYQKLADARIAGPNYEAVYRFLVTENFNKKDLEAFEKYKAIGHELYPNSEFFTYDKTDFAVGLDENFAAKMKSLDDVLAKDPGNYKANLSLGQIIYDTIYTDKEGAVPPSNAAELEVKMFAAFQKAAEVNPDTTLAFLFLGDSYMNKSIKSSEAKDAFNAEVKKRTPAGKPVSKEDLAKRAEFEKSYAAAMEGAIDPYTKAAAIYAKKEKLTGSEKQQYKKAAGYLGDIYTYKASLSKANQAQMTKYEAEAKKWNDLYAAIK